VIYVAPKSQKRIRAYYWTF